MKATSGAATLVHRRARVHWLAIAVTAIAALMLAILPGTAHAAPSTNHTEDALAAADASSEPGDVTAMGTCSYSARKPELAGGMIWAYAPWSCRMSPDEVTVMFVEIFRDGSRVKHARFSSYGTFSITNATGIACISGVHEYKVRTYGYSGDGPTSWLPTDSAVFRNTSGRCY